MRVASGEIVAGIFSVARVRPQDANWRLPGWLFEADWENTSSSPAGARDRVMFRRSDAAIEILKCDVGGVKAASARQRGDLGACPSHRHLCVMITLPIALAYDF